jgi:DNA-binding XRE family transcriptional regulator
MVQGRKPDMERRYAIARLRQQGLTLAAIGQCLGVSRQCVHRTLQSIAHPRALPAVPCSLCGQEIVSAGILPVDRSGVLCLLCLRQCSGASFGRRLQTHRLAAGLTRAELARRARIHPCHVDDLEQRCCKPHWTTLARLVQALGPDIVPPEQAVRQGRA